MEMVIEEICNVQMIIISVEADLKEEEMVK